MPASQAQRQHALDRVGKIFALLRQAAERHEPCPTNSAFAERFSCGVARVVDAFDFLETAGMIEVDRGNARRVVTICATGQQTSGVVRRAHWSRKAAQ